MLVKILGCGHSLGVPVIGCKCRVCKSDDPKNNRTRSSIYVEHNGFSLVVDTSPDLRIQSLKCGIERIDAILYTHSHADHISGIDDVRSFNWVQNQAIPAYSDKQTMDYLKESFPFVFKDNVKGRGWYKPWILENIFNYNDEFKLGDINIKTFELGHGKISVAGFRFNDFVYTTDVNKMNENALSIIDGAKVWVVDCLRYEVAETHAHFEQTMSWVNQVKVGRVILTHMSHDFEYNELKASLPSYIEPAYDGMVIKVD